MLRALLLIGAVGWSGCSQVGTTTNALPANQNVVPNSAHALAAAAPRPEATACPAQAGGTDDPNASKVALSGATQDVAIPCFGDFTSIIQLLANNGKGDTIDVESTTDKPLGASTSSTCGTGSSEVACGTAIFRFALVPSKTITFTGGASAKFTVAVTSASKIVAGNLYAASVYAPLTKKTLETVSSIASKSGSPNTIEFTISSPTGSLTEAVVIVYLQKQLFTAIHVFNNQATGIEPYSPLTPVSGIFYGTTADGGTGNGGTVYSLTSAGAYKVLHNFQGEPDGALPQNATLLYANGVLYGTTERGGSNNQGAVFQITTSGQEKVLYSFKGGADGAVPASGLIDVNGTLYGTTLEGGGTAYAGTVYSLTPAGKETILHSFGGTNDGKAPEADLTYYNNVLYGTTTTGGTSNGGTVFEMSLAGSERVLHSFPYTSGYAASPQGALIVDGGVLYGTTSVGGANNLGSIFAISTGGSERTVYSFKGGSDGVGPTAGLLDINGTFYGTTNATVFKATPSGSESVIVSEGSAAPLTAVNGLFYGTNTGGCCSAGTAFVIDP